MSDTHLSDISFTHLHLPESLARGIADAGFERCTPIQAQTLPRALAGFGHCRTGPDGHRQDRRVPGRDVFEPAAEGCSGRSSGQRAARADHRPDARARGPDPSRRGNPGPVHGPDARAGLRRRRLRKAATHPRAGRRRPDRHAGPPHRLLQAARVRPARRAGRDPRRSRPHVRPRLHHRHPLHHAAPARAGPAAEPAVLPRRSRSACSNSRSNT